ncbi:MAG: hypothetical protein RIA65_09140 [Woeseia sp.]
MTNTHKAKILRIEKAVAEKAEEVLGALPTKTLIQRIAYEAELFEILNRSSAKEWRIADGRVAIAVKNLREALEQSRRHHETLTIILGPGCMRALDDVEQIATELARPPGCGRPRYRGLERVCDVVLDAFWEVEPSKIGLQGISKRETDITFGPVGDIVVAALSAASVRPLPSAGTIFNAAEIAAKRKIIRK